MKTIAGPRYLQRIEINGAAYLTKAETAKRLSCSLRTVDYLIERGEIPTVLYMAFRVLIPEASLDRYIQSIMGPVLRGKKPASQRTGPRKQQEVAKDRQGLEG